MALCAPAKMIGRGSFGASTDVDTNYTHQLKISGKNRGRLLESVKYTFMFPFRQSLLQFLFVNFLVLFCVLKYPFPYSSSFPPSCNISIHQVSHQVTYDNSFIVEVFCSPKYFFSGSPNRV